MEYLAKTFTLPDVQVGGIIEYSFTRDFNENLIFDSHWILSHDLFTKNAKFSLKPYNSTYQPFSVRYSWQFLPEGTDPPEVRTTWFASKRTTFLRSRPKISCLPRTNSNHAWTSFTAASPMSPTRQVLA